MILNQIFDIIAVFQAQDKKIILCKVHAHIGIKGNEEPDKVAKQAIDLPGMTTSKLPYTDYYLTIRRAKNCEWQKSGKIVVTNYTISNQVLQSGRGLTTVVGNMRLS